MKNYDIVKVQEGFNWADIETISLDYKYQSTPPEIKAWAQLCYNDEGLFVHLKVQDENFRAEETGPLGQPYMDSCLEFFFCPSDGDTRYFNIEYNFNKCLLLGFRESLKNADRLIPKNENLFNPVTKKTDTGWEIFYQIPFSFVKRYFPDFKAESGKTIRANCYKCTEGLDPGHFLSWSEIKGEPFTFHKPECFGTMTFR